MNFKGIKKEAWDITKNNLWNIWGCYAFIMLLSYAASALATELTVKFNKCLFSFKGTCMMTNGTILAEIISILISIAITFLMFGMYNYLLKLVRNENPSFNDLFKYKKEFFKLFCLSFLVNIIINLGSLLIVPGIILELAYSMVYYIYVDKKGSVKDIMKASREMMKGYKWNYFLFGLSFIGWILLCLLSLGIGLIWLVPYLLVAQTLYYEELKKTKNSKKGIDKI